MRNRKKSKHISCSLLTGKKSFTCTKVSSLLSYHSFLFNPCICNYFFIPIWYCVMVFYSLSPFSLIRWLEMWRFFLLPKFKSSRSAKVQRCNVYFSHVWSKPNLFNCLQYVSFFIGASNPALPFGSIIKVSMQGKKLLFFWLIVCCFFLN